MATEVPPMLYTPEFMESEIPSAFEELTFKPGAVTKTPLLPFTSGPWEEEDHTDPLTSESLAVTDTAFIALAGSITVFPLFPGAMKTKDQGFSTDQLSIILLLSVYSIVLSPQDQLLITAP